MADSKTLVGFDETHAAAYDERFAKIVAIRDALHLQVRAILSALPGRARILCVGAGTGAELLMLATHFPRWHFTAVEPSAPMMALCRRRVIEHGFADRCTFHTGYLDSSGRSTRQPACLYRTSSPTRVRVAITSTGSHRASSRRAGS